MRQYNLCQNETQSCLDAYNLIQTINIKTLEIVKYGCDLNKIPKATAKEYWSINESGGSAPQIVIFQK